METQTIEYKLSWRDDFLKEICGFANAQGGTLYIGINDKGEVVGIEQARQLMEKLPNQCIMTMGIAPDVNLLEEQGKQYLSLRGKYLYAHVHYEGMQRVEELEIPERALRELLYNAIVHRDYRGVHTQMKVYDDKIRLWNDGVLPEGYNLQSLIAEHSSYARNKLIANAFYIAGFIESLGQGIEKVKEEFTAANLPVPTFETNSGGVLVTIPRGEVTKNVTKNDTKNDTKTTPIILGGSALKVVKLIEKNPTITTAQMAEVIGVAKKNLITLTNNLQRDGIIRHVGPRKGGHWEVIITK